MSHKFLLRSCKKNALDILAKNRLWFTLFCFFFLVVFAFLGASYLLYALFKVCFPFREAGIYAAVGSLLLGAFVFAPFWRSLQMFLLHKLIYGRMEIGLLFYCYSSKRRYMIAVRRCLGGLCLLAVACFLLTAVAILGLRVGQYLLQAEREAVALFILSLTAFFLLIIIFGFFSFRDDFFLLDAAVLSAPILSYRRCRLTATRAMRHKKAILRQLRRSFFPLFLLSFLLLGLPLIVVFPYYLGARSCLAAELIQSQD